MEKTNLKGSLKVGETQSFLSQQSNQMHIVHTLLFLFQYVKETASKDFPKCRKIYAVFAAFSNINQYYN